MLGGEKEGVQIRIQFTVDHCHLKFFLKIGACPQALDNGAAAALPGILGQQTVIGVHRHVGQVAGDAAELVFPLLQRKQRFFITVDHDADNDLVEQPRCALDDIQMPVGHGVEAAGIDGDLHRTSLSRRKSVTVVLP